jgi:nucleoid DNA-binding protein
MTIKELSNNVYRQTGISPERCQIVIESFIDELKKAILSDEKIIFQNFATFEIVTRAEKKGRNPRNGEIVTYPPTSAPKCRFSKQFKAEIKELFP